MKKTTQMRNADLLVNARQVLSIATARGEVLNVAQLMAATINRSPKMHYVDYDRASKVLHAIESRGIDAVVGNGMARMQWEELRRQVDETMARRSKLTFSQALTFVLHFRRPSRFYITANAAFRILNRHFRTAVVEVRG